MRKLKTWVRSHRGLAVLLSAIIAVLISLIVLILIPLNTPFLQMMTANMLPGDVQYCEQVISDTVRVRLSYTEYAGKAPDGAQIDPHNWREMPLSSHFMSHMLIVIPYVDYEITHDSGETWTHFGRYDFHQGAHIEGIGCDLFGMLDESHFWLWHRERLWITRDGGQTWTQHTINEVGSDYYARVNTIVEFTDANTGVLTVSTYRIDRTYRTNDGGYTWERMPE